MHLFASWASLVRSDPNESSKSNSSSAGTGRSRNEGGNTCDELEISNLIGTDFLQFTNHSPLAEEEVTEN